MLAIDKGKNQLFLDVWLSDRTVSNDPPPTPAEDDVLRRLHRLASTMRSPPQSMSQDAPLLRGQGRVVPVFDFRESVCGRCMLVHPGSYVGCAVLFFARYVSCAYPVCLLR